VALQQSSGWNQQQGSKTKRKAFPAKVPSRKKRKQIGFSKSHMNNQGKVFPNLNKCGSGGKQNSANEVIVISSDSEETTLNSRQLSIQKNDFACTSMDLLDSDSDDDNGSSVHLPINLVKTVCNVGNSSCDNEKRHSLVTTVQETEEQPSTSESCSQADKNDRVQFLKCAVRNSGFCDAAVYMSESATSLIVCRPSNENPQVITTAKHKVNTKHLISHVYLLSLPVKCKDSINNYTCLRCHLKNVRVVS